MIIAPDIDARLAALTPDGRRPLVMHHRWESLLFLHWTVPAERIQATLPAGLTVDTFEGNAYLALVPFFMRGVRPAGVPAVGRLSNFLELNVRTYVYDRKGIPGVWFYSLDCNQPLAVAGARLFTGLPYFRAEMAATEGDAVEYSSRRHGSSETARYRYRGIGAAKASEPGSLEFFLLDRYYFFGMRAGSLIRAQVSHEKYRYREAEVSEWSLVPAKLDGFGELSGEPLHRCYVDGFGVKIFATQEVK